MQKKLDIMQMLISFDCSARLARVNALTRFGYVQMKKAKEELSQVSVKLEEEIAKTLELRTKLASTDELRDQCAKLRTEVSQLRSTLATVQVSVDPNSAPWSRPRLSHFISMLEPKLSLNPLHQVFLSAVITCHGLQVSVCKQAFILWLTG